MNWRKLEELRASDGDKKFGATLINMIYEGKLPIGEFSLKGLWEACGRPRLSAEREVFSGKVTEEDIEIKEQLDSSLFPKITGALINKVVQDAYNLEYGVGDNLVTVLPSALREETIVGFTEDIQLKEVGEGMDYEEGAIGEKYHKIKNRKFGRLISLTEEMVKFDQTNQMLMRAQRIGEAARYKHEEIVMNAVLGLVNSGDYAAWRPAGTATTLYSDTSTDPYSSATLDNNITDALTDETDLDAALAKFASYVDEKGLYIHVEPKTLLHATALTGKATKILASGQSVVLTAPASTANYWSGKLTPLGTSWVDNKKGATYWYIGDFKKQFVLTQVFPLQVFQARAGNEKEFEADVVYRWKARLMEGCGAVSNRFVIQSTGAS